MGKREIEISVQEYHIKMPEMKKLLKKKGGTIVQKELIFIYIVYTHPLKKKNYFIRVRNEGSHITMTVKSKANEKYPIEYEINIDNFEEANNILLQLGCKKIYEIHKLREVWKINGCKEIVFDTYPGAETYAEIECNNEKNIKKVLKKLGLSTNLKDYPRPNINKYFEETYGIKKKRKLGDFTFTTAYKELLLKATKNKKLLKKKLDDVNKKHKKQINQIKKLK